MNFDRFIDNGKNRIVKAARDWTGTFRVIGRAVFGRDDPLRQPNLADSEANNDIYERYVGVVAATAKAHAMRRQELLGRPRSERESMVQMFYELYVTERRRIFVDAETAGTVVIDPLIAARICLRAAHEAGTQFDKLEGYRLDVNGLYGDSFRMPEQHLLSNDPDNAYDEVVPLMPETRGLAREIIQAWVISAYHGAEFREGIPPPRHSSLAHVADSFWRTWMGTDLTYEDLGVTQPLDTRKEGLWLSGWKNYEVVEQIIPDFMAGAEAWLGS